MTRNSLSRYASLALLALAVVCTPAANAKNTARAEFAVVQLAELPKEARETYRLVLRGGPFPYSKDGVTFGNYEKALPAKSRGYYHEYTVPTPGSRTRGARRIVCGGSEKSAPDVCYYSDDHYMTFKVIKE